MGLIRCEKGHYYDEQKHSTCPYCGVKELEEEISRFTPLETNGDAPEDDEGKTVRLSRPSGGPEGFALGGGREGETVAYLRSRTGMDPVTGWLVCVEGPEKGRDYRIRSERNTIGRSDQMDISIRGDETISRANHAFIVFDPRKNIFRVQAGEGRGLTYRNGEEVILSEKLEPYDVIEVGRTRLLFVPLCGERFSWE